MLFSELISMIPEQMIAQLASELDASEKSRKQISHFSKRFPDMSIEDGYRISRAWVKHKIAAGDTVRGHKIGLTSRAMQVSSQINEPDYGTLLQSMFFEQGEIPFDRFIKPRVEVELAFILDKTLEGPNVSIFDVLAATKYVVPAIEVIDSRIEQFDSETGAPRKVFDTISDNAANAGIILGGSPCKVNDVDLRWVAATVHKNAIIEESGVAAAVLNHPATGVAWLANKLAPWGEKLEAGEVVLAGSFTRPVNAERGDCFHADYGPLGSIAFKFV